MLRKFQPKAKFIRTFHGKIDPEQILNTGLFDVKQASPSNGWILELKKDTPIPETDEYDITSFVYRRNRPFHPERLKSWFNSWPKDVMHAKGML